LRARGQDTTDIQRSSSPVIHLPRESEVKAPKHVAGQGMARGMGKAIAAAASVVLVVLALGTLGAQGVGCVVEAGASGSMGGGVAVSGPPPEPMRETRPQPPDAQAVWVAGYWHWSGMQYTWIPGHWENAPPGASWHAPQYSIREGTYFYEPGSWSRRP
jgi:hypothetical protein